MNNREKKELFKKLICSDNQEDINVALSLYGDNEKTAFRIMYRVHTSIKGTLLPEDVYYSYHTYLNSLPQNRIKNADWREIFDSILVGFLVSIVVAIVVALLGIIIHIGGWWTATIIPAVILFYFIGKIIRK